VGRKRADISRVSGCVATEALVAARLGAGWGFEGIYLALAGPVRRFLAAQGAPDPDATTQEVFLRVLRSLDRFDGDAEHLRSWVFTVARNMLVDEHRAAARRPLAAAEPAPDRAAPGSEDDVVDGLDARRIHAVLGTLPHEQREVVVLRFLVDLPLAEVATIVGRSLPAVKALQHRAVARLRRQLQDLAPQPASFASAPSFSSV
jgi:RNA polymerase sigma factor (sigma-70 family)